MQALPAVVCALVGMSALAVADRRRPADHGVPGAGEHRLAADDGRRAGGRAWSRRITVRRTFGYSFATWRFHLRGEAIRSAVDIGWMRNLTVGQDDAARVPPRAARHDARRRSAASSRSAAVGRVVAVDAAGRYAGILAGSEAHAADRRDGDAWPTSCTTRKAVLLPQMTIKEAVAMFEQAESDALAVVDSAGDRCG